jgi:hypothetical protein
MVEMVVLQTCKPFVLKKGLAESHRVASRDPTVDFWGFVNKTKPHTLSHIKQEVLARRVSARRDFSGIVSSIFYFRIIA